MKIIAPSKIFIKMGLAQEMAGFAALQKNPSCEAGAIVTVRVWCFCDRVPVAVDAVPECRVTLRHILGTPVRKSGSQSLRSTAPLRSQDSGVVRPGRCHGPSGNASVVMAKRWFPGLSCRRPVVATFPTM